MVIEELSPKKWCRPPLLGTSLDYAVNFILKLREQRCPVNTTLVKVAAKCIARVMDRDSLADYGGPATLRAGTS